MKESVLHYVWQYKLFPLHGLKTTNGEPVEVVDTGRYNTDAGPDFFNAKIKIGDTLWAGNVEIHTTASDWLRHNHHKDKAYDSVILHVVGKADANMARTDDSEMYHLILPVPENVEKNYDELMRATKWVACADKISTVPAIFIQSWKNALLTERLEQKAQKIKELLRDSNQHWEEAFYIVLARNFGFGINGQPFELLAKSLSLNVLGKHKDNLLQIEAMLYGQAGLLPDAPQDDYTAQLICEYTFLKSKYNLQKSLDASQWKMSRLRPSNFPQVRIAQFAALIYSSSKLFSKILEKENIADLRDLFNTETSAYWKTHYTFSGEENQSRAKKLGTQSIDTVLINTVIPFIFSYGEAKDKQDLKDRALSLLEGIKPEQNRIVDGWGALGLTSKSAYDSQALLQLKKQYCDEKKCLRCRIGHKVLTVNV